VQLSALWRQRWLFLSLVEREIRNRYAGSMGGVAWAFLHPLLLLAIYAFVFRAVFRVEIPDMEGRPFVMFVALGLWPWMAFQEAVQRGAQAIQNNAGLIKKIAFPQALLVYGAVLATFVVHLIGYFAALGLLALWGYPPALAGVPMMLVSLLFLGMLALALALICAAIQVLPRSGPCAGPLLMVAFYATPILYPLSLVPARVREWMALNPLVALIEPLHGGAAVRPEPARYGAMGRLWRHAGVAVSGPSDVRTPVGALRGLRLAWRPDRMC